MLSLGMLAALALFKIACNLLLTLGSIPPAIILGVNHYSIDNSIKSYAPLAADTISSDIFEYMILFFASLAPFVCFTLLHLL